VTALEGPPYFPDFYSADFYLFSRLNSTLNVWHFCDATDIKNATEELKSLSKNYFQECFQILYIVAGRSVYLHKRTIFKDSIYTLNDCTVMYF
jgi:hypothetical protein